jgi:hypothetical protein
LVALIEDDPVFSNNSTCKQLEVWDQLVVFLRYMVLPGNSDATLASDMGLGTGTISKIVNRVKLAILGLREDYVKWPAEERRREIASNTALPGCVGFLDGTHFNLSIRPRYIPETFFSYKKRYSVSAQNIATSVRQIIYVRLGFYGSWHDARQLRYTDFYTNIEQYFSVDQYIVADKAYPLKRLLVPYKRNRRRATGRLETAFNERVTQERVVVEHTIGDLKIRYRRLDNLTIKIQRFEDITKVNDLIYCGCILHNFLKKFSRDNLPVDGDDNDMHDDGEEGSETRPADVSSNNERPNSRSQRREEVGRLILNH